MNGLFSMVEAFLVILAFCLGVLMDSRIREAPSAVPTQEKTDLQLTDAEKIQIAEQQKALAQCMNYSTDIAYAIQKGSES